ncbi:MAG TPA: ACT domain-containing protein [Candidatus Acidoferrales bacterium]|nr:ACT domain-containing protein [Candidatus Acidoferrales bacterium]
MPDRSHLILTAVGPDQVGLVEKISAFIARFGCNIEDSKMAVFCGEFAVIMLVAGESENLVKIANGYRELEVQTGLTFSIKNAAPRKPVESVLPYKLTASCMDHPGIVHNLSRLLSRFGINIESMETKTYAAPVSGTPMFRLEALISIPAALNVNSLRERFADIQREENIDIELAPVYPTHAA